MYRQPLYTCMPHCYDDVITQQDDISILLGGMQQPNAACNKAQPLPLCYLHLVAASHSYILVSKMVLTFSNLYILVLHNPKLVQMLGLHSWWSSPVTCTCGVWCGCGNVISHIII